MYKRTSLVLQCSLSSQSMLNQANGTISTGMRAGLIGEPAGYAGLFGIAETRDPR